MGIRAVQQLGPNSAVVDTSGAGSVATALPTPASGDLKFVRVVSSGQCYIDFGQSTITAVAGDGTGRSHLLSADGQEQCFNVAGCTHFAIIDGPGTGAVVCVSPLEE